MSVTTLTLHRHIEPRQTWEYLYVPFEVPPNTTRIDVSYRYGDAISADPTVTGGNVIDIGIFDSRGVDFMSEGFRGWSGSARREFFIGLTSATPGYLAGPIQPGTWSIALGPYKVADVGCDCAVTITLTTDENASWTHFPGRLSLSEATGARLRDDGWYRGELHCHTQHSDGDSTVDELIARAESLDLDFLAITDHNNLSHLVDLARAHTDLLLIPGFEVTTYYGHWNVWGGNTFIDFRVQTPADLQSAIHTARDRGLLVSCNHPRPYGPDWAFPEVNGYACVEIWNGPWELLNTACLSFWEARLKYGERLTAVGGSDHHFSHRPHVARVGTPTTWIYCPDQPSPAALIAAVRRGHVFVAESPSDPRLILRSRSAMMGDAVPRPDDGWLSVQVEVSSQYPDRLELCGAAGVVHTVLLRAGEVSISVSVDCLYTSYIYARLVSTRTGHIRAVTNPIYLTTD